MELPSRAMALPDVADGGGASYSALTPAAAPADQRLTAGTTSSSTITWGTPTGGSGSVSLAVTLDTVHASGSPALSGSGSSRTVTGLSDGDVVLARGVWTDAVTGETVEQAVAVSVAQPTSGASWTVGAVDIDFTSADTLAGVNSGTLAVTTDSGGTALCSIVVDPSSTGVHTVGVTNGTGVVFVSPSGTGRITGAVDLAALLSLTPEDMLSSVICVQFAVDGVDCDASNDVLRLAVGTGTDAGDGTAKGGHRFIRASGTTVTPTTILDAANTTWGSAISTPTEYVVSLYIIGGREVYATYDVGTTTLPAPSIAALGLARSTGTVATAAGDAPTVVRFDGSPLYAQVSAGATATFNCRRVRVSTYG